jgi:dephospho-CoA kinase
VLNLKKLAVTGILSCGKSSLCRFLGEFGAYVVSADAIVHDLLEYDSRVKEGVLSLLGMEVLVEGRLDRKKIAAKVFQDKNLLMKLEEILHPGVLQEITRWAARGEKIGAKLFVAEIPLLFETPLFIPFFDFTLTVAADEKKCREWYEKEGKSDDYGRRSIRQLSQEEKCKLSTFVIHNNETLKELRQSAKALYEQLTN